MTTFEFYQYSSKQEQAPTAYRIGPSPNFHTNPVYDEAEAHEAHDADDFGVDNAIDAEPEIIFQSYNGFHSNQSNKESSIIPDLQKYKFADDIIEESNRIYASWGYPKHRKQRRIFLLFACVYQSYHNLRKVFYPKQLAEIFEMDPNNIGQATKLISRYSNQSDKVSIKTALDFIGDLADAVNLPYSDREELISLTDELVDKADREDLFDDYKPQHVAILILKHYCDINSYLTDEDFENLIIRYKVSKNAIKNIKDTIHNLYNLTG